MILRSHFKVDSPAFHWELADMVAGDAPRVALAAPRGHAKSTLASLCCLLHGAAHKKFKFALLVSDTASQAEMFLEDFRREVEQNDALRVAYPDVRPGKPWSEGKLRLSNGVYIQAVGAGMKLRGRKTGGDRPDLILVDDLENDDLVASFERRQKLRRWFRATIIPMLSPGGRIVVLGTILHRDSLLSRLLRNENWVRRRWAALAPDGRSSLWPGWIPAEKLIREREEARQDGLLATWYQEFQNVAIPEEESAFKTEDIRYFDSLPERADDEDERKIFRSLYVDPAIGDKERHDYTAYTVVYATHDGRWFVVDAFRRRDDPSKIVDTIKRLHQKHKLDVIGIESVQYQKALAFWAQREEEYLPIEAITPDTDKRRRILALQPYYRAGRVFHYERLPTRLEEELLNIDSVDHDDLADSLAGHLFITLRPEPPAKRDRPLDDATSERAREHRREIERQARLKRRGIW